MTSRLCPDRRIVVLAAGKASVPMAAVMERILGSRLTSGLAVTARSTAGPRLVRTRLIEAGHPLPDAGSRQAAGQFLSIAKSLGPDDLLFVLLSGGASSLLAAPAPGLRLRDLREVSQLLLRSGAPIGEINVVRKHLSSISGGQLAAATRARIITLILSDVFGDDPADIGSGPTAPDPSTFQDACRILRRRKIWSALPPSVRSHLLAGRRGRRPETPKPGASTFRRVQHRIIGNNATARQAIATAARRAGLRVVSIPAPLTGDVRTAAETLVGALGRLAAQRRAGGPPSCLIAGGEPTVRVTGPGRGGRAQHCALLAAAHLDGLPRVWLAAFGTDGLDGPTDAAGAVVSGETLSLAKRKGLSVAQALRRHDAYGFFSTIGGHLRTGPTGTNVNDLFIGLAL